MQPKFLPGLLMAVLSIACLLVLLRIIRSGLRRSQLSRDQQRRFFRIAVLLTAGWFLLVSVLSYSGLTNNFKSLPPRPLLLVFGALMATSLLSWTRPFRQLLRSVPLHWFILFQSFRIGVEVILWLLHERQLLPVQMSWEGYNFDVLSGLLALPAAWLIQRYPEQRRTIALVYNVTGLVLLINILVISVLSMPLPIRYFHNEPANTIVAAFPFFYLPSVLVVLAATLHIWSLRQLALERKTAGHLAGA